MKVSNCNTILIVVIGLMLIGFYFFYENGIEQHVSIYSKEIEGLKVQNDTLLSKNKRLDINIELLKIQQDSLKHLVEIKGEKIKNLKQIKYEKIKAIGHYTNDKLFRFFAGVDTDSTRAER